MHDVNAQPSTRWPIHSTDRPQPRVIKPPAHSWTIAPPDWVNANRVDSVAG
jgi:hypothetical protein